MADGVYGLDALDSSEGTSHIVLQRGVVAATPGEFAEARAFMESRVRQDRCMGTLLRRKQCTFGPVLYKAYQLFDDPTTWPALVARALAKTHELAALLGVPDPHAYTGVHANFYPDEDAGVQKHADDEPQLVADAPIFSFTFVESDDPALARDFTIWKKPHGADHVEGKGRLADLTLYSGDALVMCGDMQRHFLHSIEKQRGTPKAARLNLTVRKFARAAKKKRAREEEEKSES